MKVSIIAAVARNRAIGKDNQLLWHLPDDMKFFRKTTFGHPVITGRKNYESIPEAFRPLPSRQNVIMTHRDDYEAPGADVVSSLEEAISKAEAHAREKGKDEIFIMGGGTVYREAMEKKLVDRMYLTLVDADFEADTFFPEWNAVEWKEQVLEHHPPDERHKYAFDIVVFDREEV